MGKSRLAEELASHAEATTTPLVLEGRCVPYGEANVWWPVAEALRHGAGIRSSDPGRQGHRAGARRCASPWARTRVAEVDAGHQGLLYLMGYDSPSRHRPGAPARRPRPLVVTYVERCSAHRPVVVVLSDLHWADDLVLEPSSTPCSTGSRTGRSWCWPPPARRWRSAGTRPTARHNLVVLTSTRSTASRPRRSCASWPARGSAPVSPELLDRSGGNPFFLEER